MSSEKTSSSRGSGGSRPSRGGQGGSRRSGGDSKPRKPGAKSSARGNAKGKPRSTSSKGGPKGRTGGKPRTSTKGAHAARRDDRPKEPTRAETSGWGSVAKHGAVGATIGQRKDEQEAAENERFNAEERRRYEERVAKRAKITERHDDLRDQARKAIDRGGLPDIDANPRAEKPAVDRHPLPGRPPKPIDVQKQMVKIRGKDKGAKGWKLYKRAGKEFTNDQFVDCHRTIKPLVASYPNIADVNELYGLSLYRLARWDEAIEALEAFRRLSGTAEQNPVLMDCHRALGHWADVDELWNELGESSPSAELVTEGRIVMAGAQADQGFIDSGVRTLEKGWKIPKQPLDHHVRRAYALADLLERDGKILKAKKLFGWVSLKAPGYGDAAERAE